jgi:type IV pilus assembly protein PilC
MKTIFSAPDSGSFRCDLASLSVFTKQLAVLVGSGVPLHEALDSLIEDEEARTIGSLIVPELRYAITSGHSFSSALNRFPLVFPKTYVALIRGAEETGKIGDVLDKLGLWLEAQNRIRMEVKKALTYPVFVIALTGLMTFVLFKTIVPEILKTVVELGADLPPPTRALMGVVNILDSPLFWFLVLNLVAATVWYLRTEDGYRKFLYFCNAMPVLGPVLLVSNGAKYALSLSMLLGSGVDILKSTALAAEASGSPFHKWDFKRMLRALREGEALGEALSCSPFYPQLLVDMVKVGDQTGEMAGLLDKCAEMLEEETRQRLDMLVNLLEPIVLGAVSFMVGGIMVAIMMPMANLISAL